MSASELFDQALTKSEQRLLARLKSPAAIQSFIDSLTYATKTIYRAPLRVLHERTCQCFDGAVFAAAMLSRIGYPPLVLNMLPNNRDDDHVLALFRQQGRWGAVAKSNFVGLRFREPVYRDLRELIMSYFESYYNISREKTLRGFTRALDLSTFDKFNWMTDDATMDRISDRLDTIQRTYVLTRHQAARLSLVDELSSKAGLLGSSRAGLFRPPRKKN